MKTALVGCPFRTTYGYYYESLRAALRRAGCETEWIASNCGCIDPIERARKFQTRDISYFELPNDVGPFSMISYAKEPWKRVMKAPYRAISLRYRASRYLEMAGDAHVVHLQQTLNAYGSNVAFRLFRQSKGKAIVATIHELDAEQQAHPEQSRNYNLAGAVIVHDSLMKKRLVAQGVAEELVHVVCMGVDLDTFDDHGPRDGIVFYGGHHLNKGKGLSTLLAALKLVRNSSSFKPVLNVHGHFGAVPPEFKELVVQSGLQDSVVWHGDLPHDQIASLYRRMQLCVLPFSASFAGLPVGMASANRLPIIGTKFAGIPDHVGDLAIAVEPDNPAKLAEALKETLGNDSLRADLGRRLRTHAEQNLSWDKIAQDTLSVYGMARSNASKSKAQIASMRA